MKNETSRKKPGRTLAVLVAALLMAACATTSRERSENAKSSMKTVDEDVRQALEQVDVTNGALADLVRVGQPDIRKALEVYTKEVSRMEDRGKRLTKHTDEMVARRAEYFTEWEKQGNDYTNPEIRELSEQRRAELSEVFARIPEASVGVRGSLQTYLTDLGEIRTFLSNDLTPRGIEAITPTAEKSMKDGENLKEAVRPMVAAIDDARAGMARGGKK